MTIGKALVLLSSLCSESGIQSIQGLELYDCVLEEVKKTTQLWH